jgi:hypothetical protein
MMEDGTLIWQGEHGPLPGIGDEVEKNAYRQGFSLHETQRRRPLVGFFGFCVPESLQEPCLSMSLFHPCLLSLQLFLCDESSLVNLQQCPFLHHLWSFFRARFNTPSCRSF